MEGEITEVRHLDVALELAMLLADLPFVLLLLTTAAAMPLTAQPSPSGLKWSEIVAICSVVANILLALFTYLTRRKTAAEEQLRKAEKEKTEEVYAAMRAYIDASVSQLNLSLTTLQREIEDCADADLVIELRADVKDLRKAVVDVGVGLVSHHSVCSDKFVQRLAYGEDIRSQRETIKIIRDMIQQQAAIIEKLRS